MIFEFVIVYQWEQGVNIRGVLSERIGGVLADNFNEFDFDAIDQIVRVNFERRPLRVNGTTIPAVDRVVLGFTLDLPDGTTSTRTVVDQFVDALRAAPIEHVAKFEDPLLRQELSRYAEEISALEMKLRRVLSVIYLHACCDRPYELLRDEREKPMNPVAADQMRNVAENEFYGLTFGQYVNLNQRPDMARLPLLVGLIRDNETYEALRTELVRRSVQDEDDAVFIAGLRERMEAIEAMRNCVAHNRRPSKRIRGNYVTALPELMGTPEGEGTLDKLLNRWSMAWEYEQSNTEMVWDAEARRAVEQAMESAEWNEEAKTITFSDLDEPRRFKTVSNRDELEDYLREAASAAFYVNAPWEGGEPAFKCDEDGVVEGVLSGYEDQLNSFFAESS